MAGLLIRIAQGSRTESLHQENFDEFLKVRKISEN
jgi:hypothetical protein